jgi:hypothetical protein
VSGGVIFSKLSKLLNQEDALSAPCLRGDCCSPQARPRGAQKCCGQALQATSMSLYRWLHPSHHGGER